MPRPLQLHAAACSALHFSVVCCLFAFDSVFACIFSAVYRPGWRLVEVKETAFEHKFIPVEWRAKEYPFLPPRFA